MGHKVNPKAFRLGQTLTWSSRWFSDKNYADFLKEDILIRKFIKKILKEAVIEKVEIERSANQIAIFITAARPGVIIGRGGTGIEDLKNKIITTCFKNNPKQNLKLNITEIENPNLSAEAMLYFMRVDIEKRMPFRRVMKQAIERVMKAGALGVKIIMGGRLNGAEIARVETLSQGKVPLHTLRADIDYARGAARTTYGAIGIKIWIYKGDIFGGLKPVDLSANVAVKQQAPKRQRF